MQIELFKLSKRRKEIILLEERKKILEEEIKKLEIMKNKQLSKDSDLIDIRELYVIEKNGVTYFAKEAKSPFDGLYINFFDNSIVCHYNKHAIIDHSGIDSIMTIRERFEEINAYPDGLVPRKLLEFLYYKANKIDSRTLEICYKIQNNN